MSSTAKVTAICALLAALIWFAFGQTIHFDFVNYDDMFVYQTPAVTNGVTLDGVRWAFTHTEVGAWIPITIISQMLDCQIYGLWPGGHHLTNVLLHSATAILLFLVLLRMTGALWRSAFVAALFAIHPLRAESVAWVIERKDVLSGLFFMLTLSAYARFARNPRSKRTYAMVLVWLALGLMSKSMLVTTPFVLILLDYWPLGRLKKAAQLPALLKEKIPLFVLSILSCVAALFAAKGSTQPIDRIPLFSRIGGALVDYVIYLVKFIHPVHLAAFYPPAENGPALWHVIGALLVLAALTAAACAFRRNHPYLPVGWLWYLGMLVPVLGIVQVGLQAYADRFTYLPQIGISFAVTWAAADWAQAFRYRRAAIAALAAVLLSLLAAIAFRQASWWRDSVTLWTHNLASARDNALTRFTLGDALDRQGRTKEAMDQYSEALRLNPDYVDAHNNLGLALVRQGKITEAIVEYREALRTDPDYLDAHINLGLALAQQDRIAEAMSEYHEALRINPDDAGAHNNLGAALARQGRMAEAIAEYQNALQLNPAFSEAHYNLGAALARHGQLDAAVAEYREALRINPNYADAHNNLGLVLAQHGQVGEAIIHIQKALEIEPSSLSHQNNLAWMLATAPQPSLRDGPKALELALKANQATGGNNPNILQTLAAAYAQSGQFSDAVKTARRALAIPQTESNPARAAELNREVTLYQSGHTFEAAHQ